jgi:hypothetical protein
MKRIIPYKLFESTTEENNDKYILNLSSANSVLGVEEWTSKSTRITDSIKASAEKGWSLYAMLNKVTLPPRLGRLSNKDVGEQIRVRGGVRPMRIEKSMMRFVNNYFLSFINYLISLNVYLLKRK